jgi:hypothetical protein
MTARAPEYRGPARGPARCGAACSQAGQASIELVAMVPLLVVVALAAAELLAAGLARSAAGGAAQAGAMALLQGGDPARAARAAAPGWARDRLSVRVDGRRVRVRITPPALLPATASLLATAAAADAGPPA